MSNRQQQQQQQQQQDTYNREEEYLSAQRAAVEAIHVGRETVETATRQGEQLQHAESMAEEAEYKLDRAARVLRGMTWAGWWANKFSSDITPPSATADKDNSMPLPPKTYAHVPSYCIVAAQAVQNYHANLQVLETCETPEQLETCRMICNNMYQQAQRRVNVLHTSRRQQNEAATPIISSATTDITMEEMRDFPLRLGRDLQTLRERQLRVDPASATPSGESAMGGVHVNTNPLFSSGRADTTVATTTSTSSSVNKIQQQQEDHLNIMAKHLNELGSLASNLHTSLSQQAETLDSLDEKSDSMITKSKMVTRRADRMIQSKSWFGRRPKSELIYIATIQHKRTGKYLSVSTKYTNTLILSSTLNETCLFGVWQRQSTGSKMFGLQSQYTNRWVGQNLLGQLVCSAYTMDKREEWDADHDRDHWHETKLICASAAWGNGGYLIVNHKEGERDGGETPTIGGGGLQDKKMADVWSIQEFAPTAGGIHKSAANKTTSKTSSIK